MSCNARLVTHGAVVSCFHCRLDIIYGSLPQRKQIVALSATYPPELGKMLSEYMNDPVHVCLNPTAPSLHGVAQFYYCLESAPHITVDMQNYPLNFSTQSGSHGNNVTESSLTPTPVYVRKYHAALSLLERLPFRQCVIFCNLRARAQKLSNVLNASGYPTAFISGNLQQKERNAVMEQLRQFQIRVLVSTDLTARGIDVESVNLVINIDVPEDVETYLHRIGRTGRFGTRGVAVTIVVDASEQADFLRLLASCGTVAHALPDGDAALVVHSPGHDSVLPPCPSTVDVAPALPTASVPRVPEVDAAKSSSGVDPYLVPSSHNAVRDRKSKTNAPKTPSVTLHSHRLKNARRTKKLRHCKWEKGEFAAEGCWAHRYCLLLLGIVGRLFPIWGCDVYLCVSTCQSRYD